MAHQSSEDSQIPIGPGLEEGYGNGRFWSRVLYIIDTIRYLLGIGTVIGAPIYLIVRAIQEPVNALKFLLGLVMLGIGLAPILYIFRNARDNALNGALFVVALLVVTICLMPLALAVFD